jgi:hypothetical protein
VKDFYEAGTKQRCLDLQHMMVDQMTEHVYIADGFGGCYRVRNWKNPAFERCMQSAEARVSAVSLAIDHRNRYLYTHAGMSEVKRYKLNGDLHPPAPLKQGGNVMTGRIIGDWRIRLGRGDRGLAIAPDGSLATLGTLKGQKGQKGAGYSGFLHFFKADPSKAPWEPLLFGQWGTKRGNRTGGIRFDPRGNLYAGMYEAKPASPPKGFEKDRSFLSSTGRIYKFAPTGKMGDLFPTAPAAPAKVYDVHYGAIGPVFSRTPRFGVDGYGRIYYPSSLMSKVSVIDNEGNPVLSFGTWGNRDSMGGLEGELVPTKDVPLAYPNSVDATDDYIYVSDIVNIRLMRLAKTFAAAETVGVR